MSGNIKFSLPGMSPAAVAAMKEDIAAYKTDLGTGETDMDFEAWLRSGRPQRYQVYRELVSKQTSRK